MYVCCHICVCIYVCMYVDVYLCMYVCMYISVYACMYISVYVCMCVCVCVCVYSLFNCGKWKWKPFTLFKLRDGGTWHDMTSRYTRISSLCFSWNQLYVMCCCHMSRRSWSSNKSGQWRGKILRSNTAQKQHFRWCVTVKKAECFCPYCWVMRLHLQVTWFVDQGSPLTSTYLGCKIRTRDFFPTSKKGRRHVSHVWGK